MNDNHIYYDYDSNGEIIRKYSYYAPFGYHKYSNGLSIGWFVYNKDDIFQKWIKYDEDGNPTTNIYNRFNKLIEDNKKEYTMNGGPTFYKDCPKWIQMQESLMQESL